MNTHRYNNCVLAGCNTDQRILTVMRDHEQIRSETIAKRLGLHRATISIHLGRLIDAGMAVMVRVNGHPVYAKTAAIHAPRRAASITFAGYIEVGRGLANW